MKMIIIQNKKFITQLKNMEDLNSLIVCCNENRCDMSFISNEIYEYLNVTFRNFLYPYIDTVQLKKGESGVYDCFLCLESISGLYEEILELSKNWEDNQFDIIIGDEGDIWKIVSHIKSCFTQIIALQNENDKNLLIGFDFSTIALGDKSFNFTALRRTSCMYLSFLETLYQHLKNKAKPLNEGVVCIFETTGNCKGGLLDTVNSLILEKFKTEIGMNDFLCW